ncbi:MAG: lipopolysaccharide heptosyltransferase I [Candidatus Rokubacteria bacterium]|nr:lipopolysaccharide heptosyltransferase I [Candidatus Rokubacteria bacterium]
MTGRGQRTDASDLRSIAIVKLSALGDIVHVLPVAAALRARWADARLAWVVERPHAAILRRHPAIDEVVTVDTRAWRRARRPSDVARALRDVAAVRRRLRLIRPAVALDLQGLLKSGIVTRATGAPLRIGFGAARCKEPLAARFTNRHVVPPASARHVVDQYLALLEPLGLERPAKPEFHLPWDDGAESAIEAFFAQAGLVARDRLVVLNPGAARPDKRWPASEFASLARLLVRRARARVLVLWGPGEDAVARTIAGDARDVIMAPPTDLDELLSVLRRASVVVAADTGPLHLAAALGVPCAALFGPTSSERNGPYGEGHRRFQSADGRIETIPVESVLAGVADLLDVRTATGSGPESDR